MEVHTSLEYPEDSSINALQLEKGTFKRYWDGERVKEGLLWNISGPGMGSLSRVLGRIYEVVYLWGSFWLFTSNMLTAEVGQRSCDAE